MLYLSVSIIAVLSMISLFHFYWAFGGKFGYEAVIPDKFRANHYDKSKHVKTVIATLIVALGMLSLAVISTMNICLDVKWIQVVLRIFGTIFLLRAMGDFNILGLFKKKSDSKFAYYDTRLFIPICLFLGIGLWLVTFSG